ncbi:ParB/RepB/Spo0J family partition protein [Streptomyces sp. NPDC056437]|uniref:ParB/RepB/Spo0J family partition protein n=1 Tax=Streptomyces sp. NPDC056437 TaxID=3345816 RepID=UPI00369B9A9D
MPRSKAGGSANTAGGQLQEVPFRPDANRAHKVDIGRIAPNPLNLRGDDLWEDDSERDETVTSMQEIGLIQALVVCTRAAFLQEYPDAQVGDVDFIVMAGHRRLEAARLAGLPKVRIDVQDDKVPVLDLLMLEENLKRKGLNVFQEGEGYRRLEAKGSSHAQIAKQVGKSKSVITKRIAVLALPADARAAVLDKRLGVDAAYNLLVALDGRPGQVLAAADIMRERRIPPQEAVNALLTGSARTDDEPASEPLPAAEPVRAEPADPDVKVPASRTEPVLAEPVTVPAKGSSSAPAAPEPVLPEPVEAQRAEEPARVATKAVAAEQDGHARARAARDQFCAQIVRDYNDPTPDAQATRIAVTALVHATEPAIKRAHGWVKAAKVTDAASMEPIGYRDALLYRENGTLIARLAYAVSLAEDELRAANRSRNWDHRDLAYLNHLIEAGYEPTEWERRHLG